MHDVNKQRRAQQQPQQQSRSYANGQQVQRYRRPPEGQSYRQRQQQQASVYGQQLQPSRAYSQQQQGPRANDYGQPQANPYQHQQQVPSYAQQRQQQLTYTQQEPSYNGYYYPEGSSTPTPTVPPKVTRQEPKKPKTSKVPLIIAGVVAALVVIGILAWFFLVPKPFDVTLNGAKVTVNPNSTVQTLVDENKATPNPGNLLDIEGQVLTEGGGQAYKASVNGTEVAGDLKLAKDMDVVIADGDDVFEPSHETEEPVPANMVDDDRGDTGYWTGSIHELADPVEGKRIVRTGDISGKTIAQDVVAPIDGGYKIYTVNPALEDKIIALTFDDGPWPETTNQILDILEQNGAKATFFTIGEQIGDYADSVRRADAMGCEVLTHSWDHASGSGDGVDLTKMAPQEQIDEVTRGYSAISNVIGREPAHIFRAPGGNFYGSIIDTLWPYVDAEIGWDVDTQDWSKPGTDKIVESILTVKPGEVILMHDGGGDRTQTVEALRQALPVLVSQGYRFVTISELVNYGKPAGDAIDGTMTNQ